MLEKCTYDCKWRVFPIPLPLVCLCYNYLNITIIINLVGVPQVPLPGNIVFHHGNGGILPTMTWQYGEPRAITKLSVLPVPFTITTEEDAPVDIKV